MLLNCRETGCGRGSCFHFLLSLVIGELRQRLPDQMWLFPVRLDECEIPDLDIGFGRQLTSIQSADLFGDSYGENVARLVTAIRRLLEREIGSAVTSRDRTTADATSLEVVRCSFGRILR